MNTLGIKSFLCVLIILLFCSICHSQDLASDFQQALDMVPKEPKWPSGIMYYDMQEAADTFIDKNKNAATLEFLRATLEDDLRPRKLALLSLAKLAAAEPAAESALQEIIQMQPRFSREALTAIAYLGPADGRRIAESLLATTDSRRLRVCVIEALVGLGDGDTLKMLEQVRASERHSLVRKALESAVDQLEYRLTQVPHDSQAEWARHEILCWRTVMESPMSRAPHTELLSAAATLQLQGYQFPRDLLEYRLAQGDILGILLIGGQKETWAVGGLRLNAARTDEMGRYSRKSLGEIGTSEALRVLESLVGPSEARTTNTHVFRLLGAYGDAASAEFLKALSEDERFTEREHILINRAWEAIQYRLSGSTEPIRLETR